MSVSARNRTPEALDRTKYRKTALVGYIARAAATPHRLATHPQRYAHRLRRKGRARPSEPPGHPRGPARA